MRTIEIKLYEIDEHPNKEKCFEWIRDNWVSLNYHSVEEMVDSIKKLAEVIGGDLNYAVSQSPDRGEHITFRGYDKDKLDALNADDLPLTGVCWDSDVIKALKNGNPSEALKALHDDTEYLYSDEGLLALCQANGYEFTEDGEFFG